MDSDHRLLRAVDGIAPLRSHFELGVNFAARMVSRHRIEVFLLDSHGRIAASLQRFHWDEADVVDQAEALLADEHPQSPRPLLKGLPAAGPLGAVLVACLPKCPLCWSAYLSSAGLTALAGEVYPRTLQLVSILLIVHAASVFWRARASGLWLGFALSVIGTAFILASLWSNTGTQIFGTSLVVSGALVSALGRRPSTWLSRVLQA